MSIQRHRLEHGFTIFRIICLAFAILMAWGVKYGMILAPQVLQTADKVVSLNNLQNVDVQGSAGCIPIRLKGNL